MHGHFLQMFKDLDYNVENKGDSLVITLKGDKETLIKAEKVLGAMKNLHEACGDNECCGGGHGGGCCC